MRRRALPPIDESLATLREHGVTDAPTEGDPERLRALLDLAAFVAEHRKRVRFPGFTWEDPRFVAEDAKVRFTFAYVQLDGSIEDALRVNLPRVDSPRTLLALDAHGSALREFDLGHTLYGQVTLFAWPTKPPQPSDRRIEEAIEKGWTATLKEHNLVPGRGIVVLDEHQGLLLRDEDLRAIRGLLLLLGDGHVRLWWNPFADDADGELQHWLKWGDGTGPASAWREQLYVEDDE